MTWQSVLERHPDHVQAIGMISIEQANLDVMLSELLAAILDVPPLLGQALLLTPQSATAKSYMLRNVAKVAFPTYPLASVGPDLLDVTKATNESRERDRKRVEAIAERAKTIAGKRNNVIHELWGIDQATLAVTRRQMPLRSGTPRTLVPIEMLNDIIRDIRQLITETVALTREFIARRAQARLSTAQSPSLSKSPKQIRKKRDSANSIPKLGSPKRRGRRPTFEG
jgi:hypothetical protein